MSHTYAILKISRRAYDEIKQRMIEAGREDAFYYDANEGECLDMHGLALALAIAPRLPHGDSD